jgi:PLD-like domain
VEKQASGGRDRTVRAKEEEIGRVDIAFNRPGQELDQSQLFEDIHGARDRIGIASAWFTDTDLADAILASGAKRILVVLSRGDLNRQNGSNIYRLFQAVQRTDPRLRVWVLGGTEWREGTMHHKLLAVDERIVWAGSWNFTFQARKNFENLIRIDHRGINAAVWKELETISQVPAVAPSSPVTAPPGEEDEVGDGTGWFYCDECEKGMNCSQAYELWSGGGICEDCAILRAIREKGLSCAACGGRVPEEKLIWIVGGGYGLCPVCAARGGKP